MTKYQLNEDQLQELVFFVKAKGFGEPGVLQEILDHFACKVEEVLSQNENMSLYDAMHEAHRSFGYAGFRPMVEAYQKQLKMCYKANYHTHIKTLLQHPLAILSFALLGFIYYQWRVPLVQTFITINNTWLFPLPYLILLLPEMFVGIKFLLSQHSNYFINKANEATNMDLGYFFYLVIIVPVIKPYTPIGLFVFMLCSWLYIVLAMAKYQTLQQAEKDYEDISTQYQQ